MPGCVGLDEALETEAGQLAPQDQSGVARYSAARSRCRRLQAGAGGSSGASGASFSPLLDPLHLAPGSTRPGTVARICAMEVFPAHREETRSSARWIDGGLTLKGTCALKLSIAGDSATKSPK